MPRAHQLKSFSKNDNQIRITKPLIVNGVFFMPANVKYSEVIFDDYSDGVLQDLLHRRISGKEPVSLPMSKVNLGRERTGNVDTKELCEFWANDWRRETFSVEFDVHEIDVLVTYTSPEGVLRVAAVKVHKPQSTPTRNGYQSDDSEDSEDSKGKPSIPHDLPHFTCSIVTSDDGEQTNTVTDFFAEAERLTGISAQRFCDDGLVFYRTSKRDTQFKTNTAVVMLTLEDGDPFLNTDTFSFVDVNDDTIAPTDRLQAMASSAKRIARITQDVVVSPDVVNGTDSEDEDDDDRID